MQSFNDADKRWIKKYNCCKNREQKLKVTDHVDGGRHGVGLVLIREVCHVDGVQVRYVVNVLLAGQRGQRVAQRVEPLTDVGIHVYVNAAHFPEHVQRPGASAAALCICIEAITQEGERGNKWTMKAIKNIVVQLWFAQRGDYGSVQSKERACRRLPSRPWTYFICTIRDNTCVETTHKTTNQYFTAWTVRFHAPSLSCTDVHGFTCIYIHKRR